MLAVVVAVLALAAGALLLVVALGGGDGDGDDPVRDATEEREVETESDPQPAAEPEADLDATVAEISAFVSQVRQLPFERPVEVTLLAEEDFTARVREDALEDLDQLAETKAVLVALALLPDDIDLAEVLSSFLGDSVVGFYDPETDELVVRGATLTPYVRSTLAHELTHALDDQHFELHRPALDDADDESGVGFAALVEGNAVSVQRAYEQTLSADERTRLQEEEAALAAGIDLSKVPRVLPALIGFPYGVGPTVIDALLAEGGQRRVDEAFASPPLTSEQAIDPASWLAGDAEPVQVTPPAADGEVFDQGVVGMWGLVILLEEELGQRDAFAAADGWGGDWYVAWKDGDDTCVRTTVVMDSDGDLGDLRIALEEWAAGRDRAEVARGDGEVTFTSCG